MRWKQQKQSIALMGIVLAALAVGAFFVFRPKHQIPTIPTVHEPVRFGGIVPMTGTRAAYGIPLQRAAQLAVDEINKKGGIFGDQIQIFWEDGKCSQIASKNAAEKLVTKSKVQFIFGGVCSDETRAAAPVTEAAKVILISPASTAADITNAGQFVFRLTQSDTLIGSVAAQYLVKDLALKKVAIISENTSYIKGIVKGFTDSFSALGGEIVYNQSYRTGARGTATFVSEALKENPEVIYLLPDSPTQGLQQLEKLRKEEVTATIIVDEVMLDSAVIAMHPEWFEGVIGVESYFDAGATRAKAFLEAYKAQYAEEPKFPYFMSNMYDAVYLAKGALEAVGNDPNRVREWMLARKNWPGAAGDVTFDVNGDYLAKFSIIKVKAGKAEFQQVFDTAKR